MNDRYPTSFDELRPWSTQTGRSNNEARTRFAQYAVLHGIAAVPRLKQALVFKGGNALDFSGSRTAARSTLISPSTQPAI